ncbi:MAG: TetR/AcrR family transcriptional regulator [Planctomycetes bacterium]|nr:TetR/AcrR family transcriptional regulator [Planctomycetota bacterium]
MRITSPKREARYRQLLQAALKVFARDGIDGASVADIAEAAGVAKGSVYLYFDSKEALAGDLVRHLFVYPDEGARLSEDPEPLDRILAFCEMQERKVLELGEDSNVVLHMFGHVGKTTDDQLGRGIRQLIAETRFAVQVLLRNAMSKGLVPGCDDCGQGATIVVATTYGTIHQKLAVPDVVRRGDHDIRHAVRTVLRGLGAKL